MSIREKNNERIWGLPQWRVHWNGGAFAQSVPQNKLLCKAGTELL